MVSRVLIKIRGHTIGIWSNVTREFFLRRIVRLLIEKFSLKFVDVVAQEWDVVFLFTH